MIKTLFVIVFFSASFTLAAQKGKSPFVDYITISLSLGSDNFTVDKDKWRGVWKNSSRTVPYNIDSMQFETPQAKCGLMLPRLNTGFRIQLGKDLFGNSENRLLKNRVRLNAGLGIANIKYTYDNLFRGSQYYFPDTTKVYNHESLFLKQKKTFIEFNQAIQYNIPVWSEVEFFIGFGSILRLETNNEIHEEFTAKESRYNSALRRFETQVLIQTNEVIPARQHTSLQLLMPFGFVKKLSRASELILEIDYMVSDSRFTDVYKKTESYEVHFGYTYNFSR